MKHLKLFESFSTPKPLTEDQISWLDKCTTGSWKLNSSTGLVDVDGDFDCHGQRLKDFNGVEFGHVKGNFDCHNNQIASLKGAPRTVGINFICHFTGLTDLKGAPKTVGGDFSCGLTPLKSLKGAPDTVGGKFHFGHKQSVFPVLLNWPKGWVKKGDAEFTKTIISKLKEINVLKSSAANKRKSIYMLLSLTEQDVLEYLLSLRLSTSDKFEIYGAIKNNIPNVWNKIKAKLDPEGATSDLMDLGF
jgi:hypothetical protein